jgi:hypothetical protein
MGGNSGLDDRRGREVRWWHTMSEDAGCVVGFLGGCLLFVLLIVVLFFFGVLLLI